MKRAAEKVDLLRLRYSLRGSSFKGFPSFFILTAGRSGSTLLRRLLIEQAEVYIPPESDDLIPSVLRKLKNEDSLKAKLEEFVQTVFSTPAVQFWGIDEHELRTAIEEESDLNDARDFISCLYQLHAKKSNAEASLIGDKTPFLALRTDWLKTAYPEAKFIHLIRDGRAVANSARKSLGRDLIYTATRWKRVVMVAEKLRQQGKDIFEIRYEDLVQSPETEINKVVRFLGANPRPDNHSITNLGDTILPHHKNVHKPVDSAPITKWKHDLLQKDIETLNRLIGPLLIRKGY